MKRMTSVLFKVAEEYVLFDGARKPRGVCILGRRGKRMYQVQMGEVLQSRRLYWREVGGV